MNTKELTEMVMMLADKKQSTPTLRDFFAGCALIAEMLDTAIEKTVCEPDVEARSAFLVADAMLKARDEDGS